MGNEHLDQIEPLCVEAWNGTRKVTISTDEVLRSWGPNMDTEMVLESRTVDAVQKAFDWLYSKAPVELDNRQAQIEMSEPSSLSADQRSTGVYCNKCGMQVQTVDEYHPYAACLMFQQCGDAYTVRASLDTFLSRGRLISMPPPPPDQELKTQLASPPPAVETHDMLCEMEGVDESHDLSNGVVCLACWNKAATRRK